MSLRWRIMGAIVFIVLLTVLTSIGVGYSRLKPVWASSWNRWGAMRQAKWPGA